jgi:hypothetical protein
MPQAAILHRLRRRLPSCAVCPVTAVPPCRREACNFAMAGG